MLIFKDLLTGSELLSSNFPYEVCNGIIRVSSNTSSEYGEESGGTTKLDVVSEFGLEQLQLDRSSYARHMRVYWHELRARLERNIADAITERDELEAKQRHNKFKVEFHDLKRFVNDVLEHFDSYDLYVFRYKHAHMFCRMIVYVQLSGSQVQDDHCGKKFREDWITVALF